MVQCLKNALKQQDVRAIFPIWEVSESSSRESSEAENRPGLGARLAVPRRAVKHALRQQHKRRKRNTAIATSSPPPRYHETPASSPSQCGGSGGEVETVPSSSPCPPSPSHHPPPDMRELLASIPGFSFKLKKKVKKCGLKLNISKKKIIAIDNINIFEIQQEKIDIVDYFIVLESRSKKRIALGRHSMMKLDKIMEDKGISFKKKKRIVEALVFPLVTYGCEGRTRRK
ncbi:hypothetical protein LAZ67_15001780 [Cordylochernes scorpioides]|uniref:Uncharacterized protein n=1 Tax=Cordylochernes scorpioides TaxID=51811 RepID=A0ABY6L923_9ARAC|nr:hypothetical protein LAZ67_15001780 [Cordylochernes scorpioides]